MVGLEGVVGVRTMLPAAFTELGAEIVGKMACSKLRGVGVKEASVWAE